MAAAAQCAICQTPITTGEPVSVCPACRAEYHADCWSDVGGCAVYGCSQVPRTEARGGLEIPPAYWGQESKPCPACGASIMAAAIRCRACGATFQSGRPEAAEEYRRRRARDAARPALQRTAFLVSALALVPCSAPIAAPLGLVWYTRRKRELQALPGLYPALVKLGTVVGIAETLWVAVAVALYVLRHGG